MRLSSKGIVSFQLCPTNPHSILVPFGSHLFLVDRSVSPPACRQLTKKDSYPNFPQFSPDGTMVALVRDGDLYCLEVSTGDEWRLTDTSSETITNGMAEFVAQEEMGRFRGFWWSPDSTTIACQQTDTTGMEIMHISDPSHPERPPSTHPYPRPGKQNASVKLGLVHVSKHKHTGNHPAASSPSVDSTALADAKTGSIVLSPSSAAAQNGSHKGVGESGGDPIVWINWNHTKYEYLTNVVWSSIHAPLTIVVQNRHQTECALMSVETATGNTTTLLLEKDEAWVNLDTTVPVRKHPRKQNKRVICFFAVFLRWLFTLSCFVLHVCHVFLYFYLCCSLLFVFGCSVSALDL